MHRAMIYDRFQKSYESFAVWPPAGFRREDLGGLCAACLLIERSGITPRAAS